MRPHRGDPMPRENGVHDVPDPLEASHLEPLSRDECILRLQARGVGRVGATVRGRPVIYPVNYAVHEDAIVFRTRRGGELDLAGSMPWRPLRSTVRTTSTTRAGVCWSWVGLVASATLQSSTVSKMSVFRRGRVKIETVLCASPLMRSAVGTSITEQAEVADPSGTSSDLCLPALSGGRRYVAKSNLG